MASLRRHPAATRQAVEALLCESALTIRAIAAQSGVPYGTVRAWNRQMPMRARVGTRRTVPSLAAIGAALRSHVGRQIAAFDAHLRESDGTIDTGKVLRDLTGLKRLLDDLRAEAARDATQDAGRASARAASREPGGPVRIDLDGEADGLAPQDIAALRADIARRYAAYATDGGLPEAPAGGVSAVPEG